MKTRTFSGLAWVACAGLTAAGAWAQPIAFPPPGACSVDPALGVSTVRLWDGPAPGAKGAAADDIPTLSVLRPAPGKENGTAVIVAPGGAYLALASNLEGRQVADWFTQQGVTAFVLRYRLGARYLYPVPLEDAERAVRWVRFHSQAYHLSPDRIGMAGFSAGGHLAAMVGTVGGPGRPDASDPMDRLSSRPDFLVLGYPWLNAMEPPVGGFLRPYEALLRIPEGERAELARRYTPALHVTRDTPSTFIYATTDDRTVPVLSSVRFYSALVAAGVPAELHLFRHGPHGSGLGQGDPALDLWPTLLGAWLSGQGLLTPEPAIAAAAAADRRPHPRRPGEALSLQSRVKDIVDDPAARAVLAHWFGEDFVTQTSSEAAASSLWQVLDNEQVPLSNPQIEALNAALAGAD